MARDIARTNTFRARVCEQLAVTFQTGLHRDSHWTSCSGGGGRFWAFSTRRPEEFDQFWPIRARLQRMFGQFWPSFGNMWPNIVEQATDSGRNWIAWTSSGDSWSNFDHVLPTFDGVGPQLATCRPRLANLRGNRRACIQTGQIRPESSHRRMERFRKVCPRGMLKQCIISRPMAGVAQKNLESVMFGNSFVPPSVLC